MRLAGYSQLILVVLGLGVLGWFFGIGSCGSRQREPLVVADGRVTVTNLSEEEWRDIEIWVNRYYRAQVPSLKPNGRLDAPLNRFVGAFSQQYDPVRDPLRGVEVTAKGVNGTPIKLVWGEGR